MLKRGQAAMEFLMTYGWAILAVIITIAALAYFGVLNPSIFLPESCTLFPGVACIDASANNIGVTLTVRNGLGQNLNPFTISIPGCPGSASADNGLADGEKETIIVQTCSPGFVTNSKLKKDIDVTYTATSVSHTRKGSITAKVEDGYVANGGLEYLIGTNPFYWQFSSGETTTGSIDSTTSHSGSNSFKVISNGCGDCATFNHVLAFTLPATTGTSYTYIITFWAKATDSAAKIRPVFRDATDSPIGGVCSPSKSIGTGWTQYSNTCTTDRGLNALYFGFDGPYNPNPTITYWIDDVEVKKV